MTVPLVVKLFSAKSTALLQDAIDAYVAGDGSQLATDIRGMDMSGFFDPQSDKNIVFAAVAFKGDDLAVSKVADLHIQSIEASSLADAQTALNAALANVIHHTRADGDADNVAGKITVGGAMFQATDVGRKIIIDGSERTITAYTSATVVTYSGAAITGTSLDVSLCGAECLQDLEVEAFRERDGDHHFVVMFAAEGQAA